MMPDPFFISAMYEKLFGQYISVPFSLS